MFKEELTQLLLKHNIVLVGYAQDFQLASIAAISQDPGIESLDLGERFPNIPSPPTSGLV